MERRKFFLALISAFVAMFSGCLSNSSGGSENDPVSIEEDELYIEGNTVWVEGLIKNTSDQELDLIIIEVQLYDSEEIQIYDSQTTVEHLSEGGRAEFDVSLYPDNPERVDSYDITVSAYEY